MHSKVTINITDDMLAYITDPAIFKAKGEFTRQLTGAYNHLIESLSETRAFRSFSFPEGTDTTVGKISKGENYRNQPYMVCDFPRLFKPDNVFAYRVMFWWGHYFIFTLHLAGRSLQRYWPSIKQNYETLRGSDWWVSNGQEEWEHAVSHEFYRPASEVTAVDLKTQSAEAGFLKIARTLPLQQYQHLTDEARAAFAALLGVLG